MTAPGSTELSTALSTDRTGLPSPGSSGGETPSDRLHRVLHLTFMFLHNASRACGAARHGRVLTH
jgi:hypothetical protein